MSTRIGKNKKKNQEGKEGRRKNQKVASNHQVPRVKKPSQPTPPSEPTLMFSKLEFSDTDEPKNNKIYKRKSLFSKNPKQALESIQKQKEKLKEMRTHNPEMAASKETNDSWARAILKSKGIAVHDNVRMLKKAVQRREKEKERGEKKWNKIKRQANKSKYIKQNKRKENIENRKEEVKKNRIKKRK